MCFRRSRAFLLKIRRSDSFQYKLWETHYYKIALGWLSCLRYLARITRPPQRWFSLLCCARLWDQFASRLSWESSLLWVVLLSMCSTASLSCVFAFVFNGPPWLHLGASSETPKVGDTWFWFWCCPPSSVSAVAGDGLVPVLLHQSAPDCRLKWKIIDGQLKTNDRWLHQSYPMNSVVL